jgi:3-oxoacyl-[acyl-carrier protein] reductase
MSTDHDRVPIFRDLAGKTALVTGGSKGIGEATCRALAVNGVKVAVVARGAEAVAAVAQDLVAAGGTALGIVADCTSTDDLDRTRLEIEERLGPVDILIAFAGGFTRATPFLEISEEEWHHVIDSNLTSTFLTTKAFLPGMLDRRGGSIVTMASNAGRQLDITLTASYAAAKAGIVMLTRHVAREVARHGVRVNCVAPATTVTGRVMSLMSEERRAEIAELTPLGKLGDADDSAFATLYLCSDAAKWITGVTLDVAGGRIMT